MTPTAIEEYTVPEAKIVLYLLNVDHPEGGSKARSFLSFGFRREAWETMAASLCLHPTHADLAAVETHPLGFGEVQVYRCHLTTPDGRNPCCRSVWKVRPGANTAEFVTTYPAAEAS